ncbi:MAG TPA: IS256 family transposase [Candidatus Dormibacteraeota bacterium]|nr:IS256 family transposase [Candidatus Dormibacteraeota bacterium]
MRRTVPPSAEIEAQIDQLLAVGVGESPRESLSELAKLGARLIIQRAVEDEFDAWLGRARYERRPEYQRGLRNYDSGLRNGFRARRVQTAEGELDIEIPQVRQAAETFASRLFPRTPKLLRTEPLKALVIGAFVRGLSMRDVESLCEQAGLGKLSKSTASRICEELRDRYEQFKRRDLYDVNLVALFLDATFVSVRPTGPKEGVLVAWGFSEDGERVLLAVTLGMRESYEDWQALGRDLIARGLRAPMLIVADGAPGLVKAIEQCWPSSDRQRCCVHRARNLYAKLPERERERVKQAYWRALDDAISQSDAKHRLQALVDDLHKGGYAAAAKCLADDLDALVVHLRYPARHRRRWRSTNLLERSLGEVKRRTKVMGRFPGEESCLTLVWAVLDLLITHQTNGIHFNQLDRQRLKHTRYQGTEQTIPEEVAAA